MRTPRTSMPSVRMVASGGYLSPQHPRSWPQGYGFGAEGDACSAALVSAGHVFAGDAHFTEMYALDFEKDAVLMSHMGEGQLERRPGRREVRLIHRELGIGRLGPPPTFLFRIQPGPATLASLVPYREDASVSLSRRARLLTARCCPRLRCPTASLGPRPERVDA